VPASSPKVAALEAAKDLGATWIILDRSLPFFKPIRFIHTITIKLQNNSFFSFSFSFFACTIRLWTGKSIRTWV